jgi:hypothetical protein
MKIGSTYKHAVVLTKNQCRIQHETCINDVQPAHIMNWVKRLTEEEEGKGISPFPS